MGLSGHDDVEGLVVVVSAPFHSGAWVAPFRVGCYAIKWRAKKEPADRGQPVGGWREWLRERQARRRRDMRRAAPRAMEVSMVGSGIVVATIVPTSSNWLSPAPK